MQYVWNCFWLVVPILLMNALLMQRLPRAYQSEVFGRGIPRWIGAGENLFRTAVFTLPLLMPLRVATPGQKIGLALYLTGVAVYFLAWGMQIRHPQTAWSASRAGFLAPAYTPSLWLAGIGLIGDSLYAGAAYRSWMYLALSAAFLAFHNAHAWMVYLREAGAGPVQVKL